MRVLRFVTVALVAAGLAGSASKAEACGPQTILSSVDTVALGDNLGIGVPAKLDGKPVTFLLDTGGFFSSINSKTVARLGLSPYHSDLRMIGANGTISDRRVRAHSFELGRLTAHEIDFLIDDSPGWAGIGGVLAPNLLTRYDLDIDVANHKLNLISPDHCRGKVIYWPAAAVAAVPV